MELQLRAERSKRASVLDSEALAVSQVNDANAQATSLRATAEAKKYAAVLAAEAAAAKMNIESAGMAQALTAVADSLQGLSKGTTMEATLQVVMLRQ